MSEGKGVVQGNENVIDGKENDMKSKKKKSSKEILVAHSNARKIISNNFARKNAKTHAVQLPAPTIKRGTHRLAVYVFSKII